MSGQNKILILGAGESGVGAALLAKNRGYDVLVSDSGDIKPRFKQELLNADIEFEEQGHIKAKSFKALEVIKSPGISDAVSLIKENKERGVRVISEIEFASRFTNAKMVVITGTNGKTTTTLLTYHLLKSAGFKVALAGNIGTSLARQVMEDTNQFYVIEVSSFQLDGMFKFKADIGILLNITPDHLDRYSNNFSNYIDSKFRIANNMSEEDHFIFNYDDPVIKTELSKKRILASLYPINIKEQTGSKIFTKGDQLIFIIHSKENKISIQDLPLEGIHNTINSSAAISAALILGLGEEQIRNGLASFHNAPHRLEKISIINGTTYINDSKATNVESTYYALDTYSSIIWIAGGIDKGNDYGRIKSLVNQKVKALICLGVNNDKLIENFAEVVPLIEQTDSMEKAVKFAAEISTNGDTVLLSPACASFDLFNNYEERGDLFRQHVLDLQNEKNINEVS